MIEIPYNWNPRHYQADVFRYMQGGGKRAYLVWHRRAGKDDVCLHWAATQLLQKAATYWHMLPESSQCRKAIWDAINPHTGKRRIDEAFPDELFEKRDTDMRIKCKINGAIWQLCGSDNYNSLVGSPPYGVVLSEWALADPQAWAYIQPILEENGGWALFITTPRGRNHGKTFYDMAANSPDWFAQKLTVEDTGIFKQDSLDRIRLELIATYGQDEGNAKYLQEYYCSFDSALPGSYYGSLLLDAEKEGRVTTVPHEPSAVTYTVWDLGFSDSTAIWFVQIVGREPRFIDYFEASQTQLEPYVKEIKSKPYLHEAAILPHDAANNTLGAASVQAQLQGMGIKTVVLKRDAGMSGIGIASNLMKKAIFDEKRCERGLECLRQYHREWDEKNKTFKPTPKHDWSSHGADAFRYASIAIEQGIVRAGGIVSQPAYKLSDFINTGGRTSNFGNV